MIYILDSEEEYIKNLQKEGIEIQTGSLGYNQTDALHVSLHFPPNEVKAFVYNLTKPACFDRTKWGLGQNNNSHCKIIENPTDDFFYVSSDLVKKKHPKFALVSHTQIESTISNSKFNTSDVLKAINVAGIPLIVFLNIEHVKRNSDNFLDFLDFGVGKRIKASITEANKYFIPDNLLQSYNGLNKINQAGLRFKQPLNVKIASFPLSNNGKNAVEIITNSINETFCLFIPYGQGCIFLSPQFEDPVAGTKVLLEIVPKMLKKYNDAHQKMNAVISKIENDSRQKVLSKDTLRAPYVNQEKIIKLKNLNSKKFNLNKLVRTCEEINTTYANKCFFAVGMLFRSIIDHIPPIFGKITFTEVANNCSSLSKIEKGTFKSMDDSYRKIADSFLHTLLSNKETIPSEQQVHFMPELDILLNKVIEILSDQNSH